MRRMLAAVVDKAASLWASRAAAWHSGTSLGAAAESSSHQPLDRFHHSRWKSVVAHAGQHAVAASAKATGHNTQQLDFQSPIALVENRQCVSGHGAYIVENLHRVNSGTVVSGQPPKLPASMQLVHLRRHACPSPAGDTPGRRRACQLLSEGQLHQELEQYQLFEQQQRFEQQQQHVEQQQQQQLFEQQQRFEQHQQLFEEQQQLFEQQQQQFQQGGQNQQAWQELQLQQEVVEAEEQHISQAESLEQKRLTSASGDAFVLAHPHDRVEAIPADVAVVDSREAAKAVVGKLLWYAEHGIDWTDKGRRQQHDRKQDVYFACDTEVANINVKTQSPVGHGTVICLSIYGHPQADFSDVLRNVGGSRGGGVVAAALPAQPMRQNRIWVDLTSGWYANQKKAAEAAAELARKQQGAAVAAAAAEVGVKRRAAAKTVNSTEAKHVPATAAVADSVAEGSDSHAAQQESRAVLTGETAEAAALDASHAAARAPRRIRKAALPGERGRSTNVEEAELGDIGASRSRRQLRRRRTEANHAQIGSSNGTGHASSISTSSESRVGQHQPVLAAAAIAAHAEQDGIDSWFSQPLVAADMELPAVQQQEATFNGSLPALSNISSSFPLAGPDVAVAAAGSSSSSSNSRSVAGMKGRPSASGMYGDDLPAPTVEDLLADPTARGILEEFRPFFENPRVQKVWHNYGFDRHVLEGMGFKLAGFGGDTLHMSRLWDASRKFDKGGYSLESLSTDKVINAELLGTFSEEDVGLPKRGMKERFGLRRIKADGQAGLVAQVPPTHVLNTDDKFKAEWVDYSALDAKATWNVHRALKSLLQKETVVMDSYLCERLLEHKAVLAGKALEEARTADTYRSEPPQQQQQQKGPAVRDRKSVLPFRRNPPRPPTKASPTPVAAAPVSQPSGTGGKAVGAAAVHAEQNAAASTGSSSSSSSSRREPYTLWDLYCDYWKPFGELLTSMEAEGVRVNRDHLAEQELKAAQDQKSAEEHFRAWAKKYVPGAEYMNVNSAVQIRQLLFPDSCPSPVKMFNALNPAYAPDMRPRPPRHIKFELHGLWGTRQPGRLGVDTTTAKGSAAVGGAVLWTLAGKQGAAKKALDELAAKEAQATAATAAAGPVSSSSVMTVAAKANEEGNISIIADEPYGANAAAEGDGSSNDAAADVVIVPAADADPERLAALQEEAARMKLGKMYAAMGGGRAGIEACLALEKLIEVSAIDKLLTAFIQPLQQDNISTTHTLKLQEPTAAEADQQPAEIIIADSSIGNSSSSHVNSVGLQVNTSNSSNGAPTDVKIGSSASSSSSGTAAGAAAAGLLEQIHRVHCSLNLNTETGRLSARRPNLQNQPALEKDRYKVRKAFCSEPGKTLVVADYGQLELRLLAHMANCKSMIHAFELGGDFHSRTALGMYDYIKEDIANGGCLLEWDGDHESGPPPAPLLKDKYASERRKAKILNFSIAYGKTAHGLCKDFGVSLEEAEATVERWYADRPEVREWQARQRAYAYDKGWVNTMIGRRRSMLPGIRSLNNWERARTERTAINTPIQGSAADVASAAMLAIDKDVWLRDNGWKLLLQVHDEVMLEGPKETAEQAKARVVACMGNPWENLLGFVGKPLRVDLAVDANIADTWYEAK